MENVGAITFRGLSGVLLSREIIVSYSTGEGLEGYWNNAGEPAFIEPGDNNQIKRIKEWWAVEPCVGRLAHGVSNRVDRPKCLGNAIVPEIAEMIWLILIIETKSYISLNILPPCRLYNFIKEFHDKHRLVFIEMVNEIKKTGIEDLVILVMPLTGNTA
jgi:hypothetical protein